MLYHLYQESWDARLQFQGSNDLFRALRKETAWRLLNSKELFGVLRKTEFSFNEPIVSHHDNNVDVVTLWG